MAAGFGQGVDVRVRHLLEEPVLVPIALADGVGDVVGEQQRVAHAPAPEPIVVALEEFAAVAVRVADFPDLLAVAHRLPFELAQVEVLARLHRDVGLGVFAQHAVGKRVQRVGARADVGDGEFAVVGAIVPELVIISVMRPLTDIAVARPLRQIPRHCVV